MATMKTLLFLLYELTIGGIIGTFHTFYGRHEEPAHYELTRLDQPSEEWEPVKMGVVTVYRKVVKASEWQEYRRVHGL